MRDLAKELKYEECSPHDWRPMWILLLGQLELPQKFVEILVQNASNVLPRIQKINTQALGNSKHAEFWVFREDENGGLLGGSKQRKWQAIVSWCISEGVEFVSLEGGKSSANVLLGLLRLTEAGIGHCRIEKSFHAESTHRRLSPVEILLSAMPPASVQSSTERPDLLKKQNVKKTLVLKEGSYHVSAVAGLFSLVAQLAHFIRAQNYTDLLIESGSGLTALSCVLGFALLREELPDFTLHILHLAGSKECFEAQLSEICTEQSCLKVPDSAFAEKNSEYLALAPAEFWSTLRNLKIDKAALPRTSHHLPKSAKSFGSVNASVLQASKKYLENFGLICDPIYTAKTLMLAENLVCRAAATDSERPMKLLVLNAGGALNLLGFLPKEGSAASPA